MPLNCILWNGSFYGMWISLQNDRYIQWDREPFWGSSNDMVQSFHKEQVLLQCLNQKLKSCRLLAWKHTPFEMMEWKMANRDINSFIWQNIKNFPVGKVEQYFEIIHLFKV